MITYGTGTYAGVMIVVTGDIADVPAAVQSGMTAQGYTAARAEALDNLDATVSSRNATAPDNAGIAAIKAKTDNLPADPAGVSDIPTTVEIVTALQVVADDFKADLTPLGTPLQAADYIPPANADISAIKAKTDNLPTAPAAVSDIPSAAAIATQVRTELDTELARVDAAVSTRLAAVDYVEPNNAGIAAIPTNPVLTTDARLNNLDAAVSTRAEPGEGLTAGQQTQLDELHTMRGLKAASPMTVTPEGESAGGVSLVFTGDGKTSTTVTRQ